MGGKLLLLVLVNVLLIKWTSAEYKVGVGIADITGPPVEVVFVKISHLYTKKIHKLLLFSKCLIKILDGIC